LIFEILNPPILLRSAIKRSIIERKDMDFNKLLACMSPSQLRCFEAILQASIEDNISNEGRDNIEAAIELIRAEFIANTGIEDWASYEWAEELGKRAS
jgi:hypothetical protein